MKDGLRLSREESVGSQGGPGLVHGLQNRGIDGQVAGQNAAQVQEVGVGRHQGRRRVPRCFPIRPRKPLVVLQNEIGPDGGMLAGQLRPQKNVTEGAPRHGLFPLKVILLEQGRNRRGHDQPLSVNGGETVGDPLEPPIGGGPTGPSVRPTVQTDSPEVVNPWQHRAVDDGVSPMEVGGRPCLVRLPKRGGTDDSAHVEDGHAEAEPQKTQNALVVAMAKGLAFLRHSFVEDPHQALPYGPDPKGLVQQPCSQGRAGPKGHEPPQDLVGLEFPVRHRQRLDKGLGAPEFVDLGPVLQKADPLSGRRLEHLGRQGRPGHPRIRVQNQLPAQF